METVRFERPERIFQLLIEGLESKFAQLKTLDVDALKQDIIEVIPLAYMRGRTLNEAFIILDEAQNATAEQMFMFLTRLGMGSKTVITGDVTQIDLPPHKHSGLVEAQHALKQTEGVAIVEFTRRDVVRHPLVQRIIAAYEEHRGKAG